MKTSIPSTPILVGAALLLPAAAHAQFQIDWYTIDGGGGASSGGGYSLTGTIGQPDAGPTMSSGPGGTFFMAGGFWPGIAGTGSPCRPDINNDGQVNVQDFLAFLSLFAAADPRADFNNDSQVNVQDFLAFLAAYAAGC